MMAGDAALASTRRLSEHDRAILDGEGRSRIFLLKYGASLSLRGIDLINGTVEVDDDKAKGGSVKLESASFSMTDGRVVNSAAIVGVRQA